MSNFRRSQVDHALWQVMSPRGGEVPSTFRTRVKKLLDLDRARAVDPAARSSIPPGSSRLAFNDELAGGHGIDVPFHDRHVFRLAIALELLQAGYKQAEVVFFLQEVKGELDRQHAVLSVLDPPLGQPWLPADTRPMAPRILGPKGQEVADTRVYMVIDRIELPETAPDGLDASGPILFAPLFPRGLAALAISFDCRPIDRRTTLVIQISELFALIAMHLPVAPIRRRGRA